MRPEVKDLKGGWVGFTAENVTSSVTSDSAIRRDGTRGSPTLSTRYCRIYAHGVFNLLCDATTREEVVGVVGRPPYDKGPNGSQQKPPSFMLFHRKFAIPKYLKFNFFMF